MDSRTLPSYSFLPFLFLSPLVLAEDQSTQQPTELDTVIVTANFRPVTLEDSTVSVSVITEDDTKKRGAQHIEDVLNLAPNVNVSSGASRGRFYQIRGIGERGQFERPINPSVGLYVDGIDLSRSGASATLFDVKQVEVVRGPQGTRYGANALAGLINLKTTEPSNETKLHVEATLADYDTKSMGVAAGGALVKDKLLSRFSVHKNTSDGYISNEFLNRDDTNNRDETTARAHLKWLANDDLTVSFKYLHLDIDNGYDAFNFANTRTTFSDQPGKDKQKTNALSIASIWDINSAVMMEASINYSDSDLEYSYDEDWSNNEEFANQVFAPFSGPYVGFDQYLRKRKNKSFDMRFLSSEEGRIFNDKTDWVAGLYYSDKFEGLHHIEEGTFDDGSQDGAPFGEDITSNYDTKNVALYGQLDSQINDKLALITGLRVERWKADYTDSTNNKINVDETLQGGKLGLEYDLSDQHLAHASLSRGYKAGGVNTNGSLPVEALDFDTEYLWNFEVGMNSSWLNDSLSTRVSAFYAKRKDQQVSSSLVTTIGGNVTQFDDFIRNAAEGRNYGVEAELDWEINNKWSINSSLGLLEARFDKYDDPVGLLDGLDLSGRDQAHAPRYQYALGTEYQVTPKITAGMNIEGKSDFFFSDRHSEKTGSYSLLNANLAYKKDNWTATLWGRNLLDKDYDVRGFGSFGNNPGNGYATEKYTQKGEPRIVGVSLSYDF
ncbi:MAG: TonB-dependent receptor [Thiotrichaceae bacterium]